MHNDPRSGPAFGRLSRSLTLWGLAAFLLPALAALVLALVLEARTVRMRELVSTNDARAAEALKAAFVQSRHAFEQLALKRAEQSARTIAAFLAAKHPNESDLARDETLTALFASVYDVSQTRLVLVDPLLDKIVADRLAERGGSIGTALPEVAWLWSTRRESQGAGGVPTTPLFGFYPPEEGASADELPMRPSLSFVALLPIAQSRYAVAAITPRTGLHLQAETELRAGIVALSASAQEARREQGFLYLTVLVWLALVVAGGLLLLVAGRRLIRRRFILPAERFARAASDLREGRRETRLVYAEDDEEWRRLADWFNELAAAMDSLAALNERDRRTQAQMIRLLDLLNRATNGDLTGRAPVTADALGGLTDALNVLLESLGALMAQVRESGTQMSAAISNLMDATRKTGLDSKRSSRELAQLNTHLANALGHVQRAVLDGDLASEETARALAAVEQAARNIGSTIENMQRMRGNVQATAKTIKTLGERSLEINAIVELIGDISGRTNILSLNAAIEASRAGEQGKGFAVVADEIRKLAERTAGATKDISSFIEDIQIDSNDAVVAMEEIVRDVEQGWRQSELTAQALRQIGEVTRAVARRVEDIAQTSRTLVGQLDQSSEGLKSVYLVSRDTTAGAYQSASETRNLLVPLERLNKVLARYDISGKPEPGATPWILPAQSEEREQLLEILAEPDFSDEDDASPSPAKRHSPPDGVV